MRNPLCSSCSLGPFARSRNGQACIWAETVSEVEASPFFGERGEPGGTPLADRGLGDVLPLLVVGQNPGREENREGRPFIGPSGKLVRELLGESNFPYALTNAVKCHSEDNREPTSEELEACRPYLTEEILHYRPIAILALGNPALKSLTGRSGVMNYRGQPQELRADIRDALRRADYRGEYPSVLASVHPAYVLRVPNARGLLEEDITGAQRFIRRNLGLEDLPEADWVEATCSDLDPCQPWTFDIESTTSNYRDPRFEIHLIGIDDQTGPVKIITNESDFRWFATQGYGDKALRGQGFGAGEVSITFNGLAFDGPALAWKYGGPRWPVNDAMLLAYLLDETMPHHTLEACAIRWLGVPPWKDKKARTKAEKQEASAKWMAGPQNEDEWHELKQYNARDVLWTRQVWYKLWERLDPQLQALYTHLMVPAAMSLTRATEHGTFLLRENIDPAKKYFAGEVEKALAALQRYAEDNYFGVDFNPNSTRHAARMLFDTYKLNPIKLTKGGKPSTDAESLKIIASKAEGEPREFCEQMLLHRENAKMEGFLERYESLLEEDGRLHPSFSLINTETGRTSSYIHTMPRKTEVRRIVGAPPGRKLIIADESQVELRIAAWLSRDPEMLATYKEGKHGGDLHTTTAKAIIALGRGLSPFDDVPFDKQQHKHERTLAKGVNFGTMYGSEAPGLRDYIFRTYGIKISLAEAQVLRDEVFFGRFKGLPPWYDSVISEVKATGQVRSAFGRIRRLPNIKAPDIELRAEAARQAINTKIQPVASDIALISFFLIESNFHWLSPVMFNHDACIFEVDDTRAEEGAKIVQRYMEQETVTYIADKFRVDIDVPLVAEATISQEWTA